VLMTKPTRPLPPGLAKLQRGLSACSVEALAYARCCTATLPAVQHNQCTALFERLAACVKAAAARP
jgi:hypothetical protein